MFSVHLILVCAALYVLLADRIFLKVASGGRGVLQVMPLVIILLAGALILTARQRGGTRLLRRSDFWPFWFPYLLLATVLPVLGVLVTEYPVRTVFSIVPGLAGFSFLVLGSWLTVWGAAGRRLAAKYLFVGIVAEFLFTAVQFARLQGCLPAGVFDSLYKWDLSSQMAYSKAYMITGRSVGTYVNPNTLGFWGVVGFWGAVHVFRGAPRVAAIVAALGTLAVSQSRGSMLALLVSMAVWLVYLALSTDKRLRPAFDVAFVLSVVSLVGLMVAWASSDPTYLSSRMGRRFATGIAVTTGGVAMDANAQGRVDAWVRAVEFYQRHPLGTLGEPQFRFGGFIDNDLLRILLQGGPGFLVATLLTLGAGIRLIEFGTPGRMIATWSAAIAVNAMTANPLSYPAIGLYWMVVGYYLGSREKQQRA